MNQLKLNQLKAAGGVAVELIEEIEHLRAMNAKAVICMDEQKAKIKYFETEISRLKQLAVDEYSEGFENGLHASGDNNE